MSMSNIALFASAAALVSSAAFAGTGVSLRASEVKGFSGANAPTKGQSYTPAKAAKCGTSFGAELPTPDGLIAWNDTSGTTYNTGGGADFTCTAKTKISAVWVYGYNAPANPELYNVAIYKNDPADGSDEGNDKKKAACSYTGISGAGGGSYPTHVLTQLTLPKACSLKAGKYWVEVQDNDPNGPWYWEMSSAVTGSPADWVDRNNAFGVGCTQLDNDLYLQDCLGYDYQSYMLELH